MINVHKYFVFAEGLKKFKPKFFSTRKDAEGYMHEICAKNNVSVECTEDDKHERVYSNNRNVIFYINRI